MFLEMDPYEKKQSRIRWIEKAAEASLPGNS